MTNGLKKHCLRHCCSKSVNSSKYSVVLRAAEGGTHSRPPMCTYASCWFRFGWAHFLNVHLCAHVCVCVLAVSASDGHSHTRDMTTDWQTDHQHSSQPPRRTLSGCQQEFMQKAGVVLGGFDLFCYCAE